MYFVYMSMLLLVKCDFYSKMKLHDTYNYKQNSVPNFIANYRDSKCVLMKTNDAVDILLKKKKKWLANMIIKYVAVYKRVTTINSLQVGQYFEWLMHVTTPIITWIDTGIQPRCVAFEINEMSNGQIGYSRHWLGSDKVTTTCSNREHFAMTRWDM